MKQIITLAFTGFTLLANSQTPLIAHKSHAGSSLTYRIDPLSNFGRMEPMPEIKQPLKSHRNEHFTPLNDSTIILEVRDWELKIVQIDTLQNKSRYSPSVFQFKYQDSIRKKEREENERLELEKAEQIRKQELESPQQINQETTPAKKKKKSYLLFLFGITGGGMLLMKLFGRFGNKQQSIV